jgi:glyoxalase family protein
MTYFPFPKMAQGRHGVGEVGTTVYSVPEGYARLLGKAFPTKASRAEARRKFGEKRLPFAGPDGDGFALVEDKDDAARPGRMAASAADDAIRGFHSVAMRLRDGGATEELLKFMGYEQVDKDGVKRLAVKNGNGADVIDIETLPNIAACASPISAPARCIMSPSPSRTAPSSSKCARR